MLSLASAALVSAYHVQPARKRQRYTASDDGSIIEIHAILDNFCTLEFTIALTNDIAKMWFRLFRSISVAFAQFP
jgi:hypothetical protein